jgi:hypothetical protein
MILPILMASPGQHCTAVSADAVVGGVVKYSS